MKNLHGLKYPLIACPALAMKFIPQNF